MPSAGLACVYVQCGGITLGDAMWRKHDSVAPGGAGSDAAVSEGFFPLTLWSELGDRTWTGDHAYRERQSARKGAGEWPRGGELGLGTRFALR